MNNPTIHDRPPYLHFDGDTVTVYIEDWWDNEYRKSVAVLLSATEKIIGRMFNYVFTKDPPPPGLLRADEMHLKLSSESAEYKN